MSWCDAKKLTRLNLPLYKVEDTVKETCTDEEYETLLKSRTSAVVLSGASQVGHCLKIGDDWERALCRAISERF